MMRFSGGLRNRAVRARPVVIATSLAFAAAVIIVLSTAHLSSAHAALIETDPTDGSILEEAPRFISLRFNEPVDVVSDGLRLFDTSGEYSSLSGNQVGNEIQAVLPADLAEGSYVFSWRVVSADGHPISGTVRFDIGQPSAEPVVISGTDLSTFIDRTIGIVQGTAYATLLLVVGLALFRHLISPPTLLPALEWSSWFTVLGLTAEVSWIALMPLNAIRQSGEPIRSLWTDLNWASNVSDSVWLATVIIAICIFLADRLGSLDEATAVSKSSTVLVLVAAAVALSLVGHSRVFQPTWLTAGSNTIHVIAASAWLGGLLGLFLVLNKTRHALDEDSEFSKTAVVAVTRFSTGAAITVVALALAGSKSAWRILPTFGALWELRYGQLLLAKILLTAVVIGIAGFNRFRLLPRLDNQTSNLNVWKKLLRTVLIELGLVLSIALITGALVIRNPQTVTSVDQSDIVSSDSTDRISQSAAFGAGQVVVTIQPSTVGKNLVEISFTDESGGIITPLEAPSVTFSQHEVHLGPIQASLLNESPEGVYRFEADVPIAGDWEFSIAARISRFEEPIGSVTIPID